MSRLPVIPASEAPARGDACSKGGIATIGEDNPALFAGKEFAGNVTLVTLGCAKNLVDSEIMLGALRERGFRPISDPANADLIVVNTCAFLQSAVEEGVDRILEMAEFKKTGRCRKLIVAGCMVERYRDKLVKEFPEVDRFINTDELLKVADDGNTTEECLSEARRPYFLYDEKMPRIRSTGGHSAFLKISEGCNRPCAFCIIPKIRGEFRSRPVDSIIAEAKSLLSEGVRELNLVGQDLTAYGSDFPGNRGITSALPELLKRFSEGSEVSKRYWVRLLYAYPIGVTEELIRQIVDTPYLCTYLDLPLQHISSPVLKNMRRPLGAKNTRRLIETIRSIAPELKIRTTFITGFPGETDDDVKQLQEFIAEGHFTHVGIFTYSQEEEALAYTFEDQVDDEVKEERKELLMNTQKEIVRARNEGYIGKQVEVLIDGYHEESDLLLSSRTAWQAPETDGEVIINDVDDSLRDEEGNIEIEKVRGRFATVEVTESTDYDLVGRLITVEG